LGDVGQRRLFRALLVQQLACGGDEALPLAGPPLGRTFLNVFR